jgi:hypothetical protein
MRTLPPTEILGPRGLAILAMVICLPLSYARAASDSPAPTQNLTYARDWGRTDVRPQFAAFHSWANRYAATPESARASIRPEGISLAKQRRAALLELIKSDPAHALALSVPASVQRHLPDEILREMETRVAGLGDLSVRCAIPTPGGPAIESVERFVILDGHSYRASVSGRRLHQTTKHGIPLHGVALDGVLAVAESALREFESDELPEPSKPVLDVRTPAEKAEAGRVPVLAQAGGKLYRFGSRARLLVAEAQLQAAEARMGPEPIRSVDALLDPGQSANASAPNAGLVAESSYSEGRKSVLIIRVDFPDLPGDPGNGTFTEAYVQNIADTEVKPFFAASSYGITSLSNTVSRLVYRMPQRSDYYATNGANYELHGDARNAASTDYAVAGYDRVIVLFSGLWYVPGSFITYGGMGEVGGPNIWVNGEFDFRVVAHELGHTYGVWHGNLWQVGDSNPISPSGSSTEYGDDFETMGANFANDQRTDFNPWFKNMLNWIHDAQVRTVTASGTYRVKRFDHLSATGTLALKVVKDGTRNYWISCRRNFTDNTSMQHGAYIIWGYNANQHSDVLDMTTPGWGVRDAALAIGSTFIDDENGITIRTVAEGGSTPDEYVDVQIAFGPVAPWFITQPTSLAVPLHRTVTFTAEARGFPAPTYQWQRLPVGTSRWRDMTDDATYTGTTTAWLTVNNPTIAQSGDQFRCIASNRTRPDATSDPAQLTVLPPPANDNFAAAILLSGTSVRVTGSNNNAGKEAGEPNHAYNIGGHSVWWKWVAPASGMARVTTFGSSFDTLLAVYTGSSVSALTQIAANDDSDGLLASAVQFNALRGTTYAIAVDGYAGDQGTIALNLESEPARRLAEFTMTNGVVRFILSGQAASVFVVQASTNLVDWLSISTNTVPSAGSALIVDTSAATRPHCFYRALPR